MGDGLAWHVCPQDQGQIVEVAYASDPENGRYLRRTLDRSDRSSTLEALAFEAAEGEWEPWNGLVPRGVWEPAEA